MCALYGEGEDGAPLYLLGYSVVLAIPISITSRSPLRFSCALEDAYLSSLADLGSCESVKGAGRRRGEEI